VTSLTRQYSFQLRDNAVCETVKSPVVSLTSSIEARVFGICRARVVDPAAVINCFGDLGPVGFPGDIVGTLLINVVDKHQFLEKIIYFNVS
jgi:hypothetical protein